MPWQACKPFRRRRSQPCFDAANPPGAWCGPRREPLSSAASMATPRPTTCGRCWPRDSLPRMSRRRRRGGHGQLPRGRIPGLLPLDGHTSQCHARSLAGAVFAGIRFSTHRVDGDRHDMKGRQAFFTSFRRPAPRPESISSETLMHTTVYLPTWLVALARVAAHSTGQQSPGGGGAPAGRTGSPTQPDCWRSRWAGCSAPPPAPRPSRCT